MPTKSPKIREIHRQGGKSYLRTDATADCPANEIEIDGGDDGLKLWIAEQVAQITTDMLLALQLQDHVKTDPNLTKLDDLRGKTVTLDLTSAKPRSVTP